MSSPTKLASQARLHALADLEVRIAWAEKVRDHHNDFMSHVAARNQNPRAARMRLQHAEDRLAQLQRSREVLTGGEDQSEAEAS